jgi:hypothetical protein
VGVRIRLAALLLLAGGCGSAAPADLPPPARPVRSPAPEQPPAGRTVALDRGLLARYSHGTARTTFGRGTRVAAVAARARELVVVDRRTGRRLDRAPAGVGPSHVVSDGARRLFVVDTEGDGLLLFELRPELELVRRVALPGAPYGIAIDRRRHRLWVTLTARNRLVEVTANGRPRPLRSLATVRQPDAVAVDERTGRVFVIGERAQVVDA